MNFNDRVNIFTLALAAVCCADLRKEETVIANDREIQAAARGLTNNYAIIAKLLAMQSNGLATLSSGPRGNILKITSKGMSILERLSSQPNTDNMNISTLLNLFCEILKTLEKRANSREFCAIISSDITQCSKLFRLVEEKINQCLQEQTLEEE